MPRSVAETPFRYQPDRVPTRDGQRARRGPSFSHTSRGLPQPGRVEDATESRNRREYCCPNAKSGRDTTDTFELLALETDALEPAVLLLEQLQAFGLFLLERAVPQARAIEGLVGDSELAAAIGTDALRGELLDLAQLGDDLLHSVLLYGHESPPSVLSERQGTIDEMDRITGGRTLPLSAANYLDRCRSKAA